MKIVICGSMSVHKKMSEVKQILENMDHNVIMPSLENISSELDENGDTRRTAHIKIRDDLIRDYFKKIKWSDAVLIVNENKKGLDGYIGGNTFLEIGFAFVLEKEIFILSQYTNNIPYADEINAMQPKILNGDLSAFA